MTLVWMLLNPAGAGELREPVLALLNAFEEAPSAEAFAKLGPGAEAELLEIAADTQVPHSRRGRAVTALGRFASPRVRDHLQSVLTGSDNYLKRKAVWALALGFGDAALADLDGPLNAEDAHLRTATARALHQLNTPAARARIETRLAIETDAHVRSALGGGK